jgi:hypothetical protein
MDPGEMSPRITNKTLRKTFDRLNQRYFGGALKDPPTLKFEDLSEDEGEGKQEYGAEGTCDIDGIRIEETLRIHPDLMILILMHEMVHWKLRDWEVGTMPSLEIITGGHGPAFKQEIYRLWNSGAYEGLL